MDRMGLTNAIRREAYSIKEMRLPFDVFPNQVQNIIFDLTRYENYNIEYCASVVLSAIASAIGNSHQIHIKGAWCSSPSLYMMLIGRPGLGKTPPLNFLYRPFIERDEEEYYKYCEALKEYDRLSSGKDDSGLGRMPELVKTVISDFTPEAMLKAHKSNLRGISVVVDEIAGMFKSTNRYSSNNILVEMLLSAWSGQPLDSIRKSERDPTHIKLPFIGIIGTIQTNLLTNVFCEEYLANGLLDRFIFAYPQDKTISEWSNGPYLVNMPDIASKWSSIVSKILELPCNLDESGHSVKPVILEMSDEARAYLYAWHNSNVREINSIKNDLDVESRKVKLSTNASRIALVLQIMRWASGESHKDHIDLDSIRGAIFLMEYFEDTYYRIQKTIREKSAQSSTDWLMELGNTFSSREAEEAVLRAGLSRRYVYKTLDRMTQGPNPILIRLSRGQYAKTSNACSVPCTNALTVDKILQNDSLNTELKEVKSCQSLVHEEVHSAQVHGYNNLIKDNDRIQIPSSEIQAGK